MQNPPAQLICLVLLIVATLATISTCARSWPTHRSPCSRLLHREKTGATEVSWSHRFLCFFCSCGLPFTPSFKIQLQYSSLGLAKKAYAVRCHAVPRRGMAVHECGAVNERKWSDAFQGGSLGKADRFFGHDQVSLGRDPCLFYIASGLS